MNTKYLQLADGILAYDDTENTGPLVIMVPGMGDVRAEYRFVTEAVHQAGYRVVTLDLRGHGESSVSWPEYSVPSVGQDILALIQHLDAGPAIVVGTSFSPGAAVWTAAENPVAISGLVLIGAFVRTPKINVLQKVMLWVLMNGPWAVSAWGMFYRSLYISQQPEDFILYSQQLKANLSEPGRFAAVRAMGQASKDEAEVRLSKVNVPTLVVMGSKDPDFASPAAEAQFIADQLAGQVEMIEGAGHYPQAEMPDKVLPVLLNFLESVPVSYGA